tara:strand:- start:459174 stop:461669 length:2496 start_codon:yes stop_codon:yes gene_type:complete
VPEGKYLLDKNTIIVNDKKSSSPDLYSYLRQKPNQKILGFPFSLHLYNLANKDTLNSFDHWLNKKPKRKKRLINTFSEKQVKGLENTSEGINKWLIRSGNPPVISDLKKIESSAQTLKDYYFSKGYWDVLVTHNENNKRSKRTEVDYLVTTNDPYFLDSVRTQILSPQLDSIYKMNRDGSFVVQGDQFNAENFEKEQDRLIALFRNSGVYSFGKDIMEFDIDISDSTSHKKNILLKIQNRRVEKNDSVYTAPYKIQKIKDVNVFTDFTFGNKDEQPKDSATYSGINFYAVDELQYNPKYLANSIIIQPDSIYKDTERDLTRQYLRDLQNFRPSVDIKYQENNDETLTANIYLTPLKKYSVGWDAEFTTSNIKPFGILGKFSFLNRNVFKGTEILELSFQGSFINTSLDASDNSTFFNAWEIGSGATLKIPRILFPLKTSQLIPKRMAPKTNIGVSLGIQRNIGLDRQNITGSIDYTWKSSTTTNHKFELLNVQYIKNQNTDNYFSVYGSESRKLDSIAFGLDYNNIVPTGNSLERDENGIPVEDEDGNQTLIPLNYIGQILNNPNLGSTNPEEFQVASNVNQQRDILIENVLVPVMSYSYNYTNRENFRDNSFSSFTGRLISSGSITSLFVKKTAESGKKEIFGLPIAQYFKTELEYKKYWGLNINSSLVFRGFIGAAIPFGNSDDIPFSRSYRAGGSNDIRAWRTFDLGPGAEDSNLEFNTGNLKLTGNLEYRFKFINSLNGALFIDVGNIWDISNSPLSSSKAKFNSINSLEDMAVGSGFGARYDFGFLVFRLDVGFKTFEPYNVKNKKWFRNYNFNRALYNIGINYPF